MDVFIHEKIMHNNWYVAIGSDTSHEGIIVLYSTYFEGFRVMYISSIIKDKAICFFKHGF